MMRTTFEWREGGRERERELVMWVKAPAKWLSAHSRKVRFKWVKCCSDVGDGVGKWTVRLGKRGFGKVDEWDSYVDSRVD